MHCFHYNASKYIKFEYLLGLDYDEPNHHSITEKERYNDDTQFEIKIYNSNEVFPGLIKMFRIHKNN
jgi:hypothetical protein